MSQVTLFSGPERRRRWSEDERLLILNEAFAPGSCVAEVSRRYDVSTSLTCARRRKFRAALPGFVFAEAIVVDELQPPSPVPGVAILIELPGGARVSAARKKSRGDRASMIYPIALEAVQRIDELFDIERAVNGSSTAERLAVRQELSTPLIAELHALAHRTAGHALAQPRPGEGDQLHVATLGRVHSLPR